MAMVAITAVTAIGLISPVAAAAPPSASDDSQSSTGCIELDQGGEQTWTGEATSELVKMSMQVQAIVDGHPQDATGVALCSRYDGVAFFVKNRTPVIDEQLATITKEHPTYGLEVHQVPEALSTLITATNTLIAAPELTGNIQSAAPDIYTGAVSIEVPVAQTTTATTRTLAAQAPEVKSAASAAERVALAASGRPVKIIAKPVANVKTTATFTRNADGPFFHMGGRVENTTGYCSLGVPLRVQGKFMALTAGHCTGSDFYNNGQWVGGVYTTSYPGNGKLYGDWKLITGGYYLLSVFNGPRPTIPTSDSILPITSAQWGGMPVGARMCTSGVTTGQWCTFTVKESYASVTIEDVKLVHQMRMKPAGGMFEKGDSGGPCYYADGNGGVIVTGIVQGFTDDPWYGIQAYCTQLSGVHEWPPGAAATLG